MALWNRLNEPFCILVILFNVNLWEGSLVNCSVKWPARIWMWTNSGERNHSSSRSIRGLLNHFFISTSIPRPVLIVGLFDRSGNGSAEPTQRTLLHSRDSLHHPLLMGATSKLLVNSAREKWKVWWVFRAQSIPTPSNGWLLVCCFFSSSPLPFLAPC